MKQKSEKIAIIRALLHGIDDILSSEPELNFNVKLESAHHFMESKEPQPLHNLSKFNISLEVFGDNKEKYDQMESLVKQLHSMTE